MFNPLVPRIERCNNATLGTNELIETQYCTVRTSTVHKLIPCSDQLATVVCSMLQVPVYPISAQNRMLQ